MGWERNHYRMEPAVSLMAGFFLDNNVLQSVGVRVY